MKLSTIRSATVLGLICVVLCACPQQPEEQKAAAKDAATAAADQLKKDQCKAYNICLKIQSDYEAIQKAGQTPAGTAPAACTPPVDANGAAITCSSSGNN